MLTTSTRPLATSAGKRLSALMAALVGMLAVTALLVGTSSSAQATGQPATVQTADGAADEVTVGAYVTNVQDVDLEANTYTVDMYVWMRWTNPDLDPFATLEPINVSESWGFMATPLFEEPQTQPDGSLYMATRYQGKFNSALPLDKYPFDAQDLKMKFEDTASTKDLLVFVPDSTGAQINPDINVPGYVIGQPTLTIVDHVYASTFGDLNVSGDQTYSQIVVTVPVTRPAIASAVKILLPIFLIVLAALLVFTLNPTMVEARIGMAITALLTLVALQFATFQNLPQVGYLMMLDVIFSLSYALVIGVLAIAAYTAVLVRKGQEKKAIKVDWIAFGVAAAVYVSAVAVTMWAFLQ